MKLKLTTMKESSSPKSSSSKRNQQQQHHHHHHQQRQRQKRQSKTSNELLYMVVLVVFAIFGLIIDTETTITFLTTLQDSQEQQHANNRTNNRRPFVVQYDYPTNTLQRLSSSTPSSSAGSLSTQYMASSIQKAFLRGKQESDRDDDEKESSDDDTTSSHDEEGCRYMHEWQSQSFQVCNPLHEYSMADEVLQNRFQYLARGGNRMAIKAVDGTHTTPVVLKLLRYDDDITLQSYERNRRDGMTMERLASSPYILNSYGFCGVSEVVEYANGGMLQDLIRLLREKTISLQPIDKLRIAIQLIKGVADLHTFESDSVTSVSHNDIGPDQIVFVNGVYKLNDFHLSYFLKRNQTSGVTCPNSMKVRSPWVREHAPEETYRKQKVDNEKADVYAIGNMMYYVLTHSYSIFEDVPNLQDVVTLLRGGKRPSYPDFILQSNDQALQAIKNGINLCWKHSPEDRPRAQRVAEYLIEQYESITNTMNVTSTTTTTTTADTFRLDQNLINAILSSRR
jgi:serine/threonine protein kinase